MSERISYAGEHGNAVAKPVVFLDRVLGVALAFFGSLIALALGPFTLFMTVPSLVVFRHSYFSSLLSG